MDDEEVEENFKMGADDDELIDPLDAPEIPDLGDDDDPENRFH